MEFVDFWNLYPRKVCRKPAETAWNKLKLDERTAAMEAILIHIKYWQVQGTMKEFIPHASTWLNQARWEDELEIEQPKQKQADIAWWGSEALIIGKGRELNLEPRPGESIHEFKGRVASKIRQAA